MDITSNIKMSVVM